MPFDDPNIRILLGKIKRGQYEMPSTFSPLIQDLIRNMIQVDPSKRISLEGIKNHPAFLHGLPPGYVIPAPLPLPQLTSPVDIHTVDPQFIRLLTNIGFKTRDELEQDLQSQDHTMAKVFLHILKRSAKLEQIPWNDCTLDRIIVPEDHSVIEQRSLLVPDDEEDEEEPTSVDIEDIQPIGNHIKINDPFHRKKKKITDVSSPEIYSMALKADWSFELGNDIIYDQEQSFQGIHSNSNELMFNVQKLLNEMNCMWYHPDDMRIIAKMPNDVFLTFDALYDDNESVSLFLHMSQGTQEIFNAIISQVIERCHQP